MSPDQLTSLLAASAPADPERTALCPDEHVIAGYVDGGLDDAAAARLEQHLSVCTRCLALVGVLSRERRAAGIPPVSDEVLRQARALVTPGVQGRWRLVPQWRWHVAPQWAAAAALVLAVPLLLQLGRMEPGAEEQVRRGPAVTRTLASSTSGMRVLSPAAGAAVSSRQLTFRWTEVPGTPFYDVRIVTDAGDVVIQQRVTDTTWRPPAQLRLQQGAEYFVHVDAYPSGEKAVSSDHVPFRVSH